MQFSNKLPINAVALTALFNLLISFVYSQPRVLSFSPTSGPVGSTVVIRGTNFDSVPSRNLVSFGTISAQILSSTDSTIEVFVPAGASNDLIVVNTLSNDLLSYSSKEYKVTFPFCGLFDTSSFTLTQSLETGTNPTDISTADFNGNGKLDLLVTNYTEKYLSVFKNNAVDSIFTFDSRLDITADEFTEHIDIADFDGDGKVDFAVTNIYLKKVSVYKNTSKGDTISFDNKIDINLGADAYHIEASDVDQDGKADLIVTFRYDDYFVILPNNSANNNIKFGDKITVGTSGGRGISACDLDGDQKPDIAITSLDKVLIYRNTSTKGNFSFEFATWMSTGDIPEGISARDIDNDGKPDIITANRGFESTISILRNMSSLGQISFESKIDYKTGQYSGNLAVTDIDGDGKSDITVIDQTTSHFFSFINNSNPGTISLKDVIKTKANQESWTILVADLNNDGKPDAVTGNGPQHTITVFANEAIPNTPEICMVSVDSNSVNNLIYWNKTAYNNVDSFVVYRETVTGLYQRIGAVPVEGPNYFTDTVRQLYFPYTGDPNVGSYRYKLQIRDTCGLYSKLSLFHNTIFVVRNGSSFSWNHYQIEGQPTPISQLDAYHMLRKDSAQGASWEVVAGVSSSQQTLNDPEYSNNPSAARRIETQWNISCSNDVNKHLSYSNRLGTLPSSSIEKKNSQEGLLKIYPNPFSGSATIQIGYQLENLSLVIIDVFGQKLRQIPNINQKSTALYQNGLPVGLYFLILKRNEDVIDASKIIIK